MPHATNEQPLTNGERPSSKFVDRLQSYPVVNDSLETFKSNPYGKKSLELVDSAYNRFGKPVEPYLETPYSYAKPYVAKADELADSGLGAVEERFPVVKADTNTIVDKGKGLIWWPLDVAGQGRDYALNTWNDEYSKTAKQRRNYNSLTLLILAVISTELRFASDFFQAVADFLGPKYEESKKKSADYVRSAQDNAQAYAQKGQEKLQEYKRFGQEKASEGQQKAEQYSQQGQQKASEYVQQGQQKANGYAEKGQQKANEVSQKGQEKTEQAKQKAGETKDEAQRKVQN